METERVCPSLTLVVYNRDRNKAEVVLLTLIIYKNVNFTCEQDKWKTLMVKYFVVQETFSSMGVLTNYLQKILVQFDVYPDTLNVAWKNKKQKSKNSVHTPLDTHTVHNLKYYIHFIVYLLWLRLIVNQQSGPFNFVAG